MSSNPLRTVLIGQTARLEFAETVRSFSEKTNCRSFPQCESAVAAILAESERPVYDLIVLLQSFPDEFAVESFNRLRLLFPLTPFVLVAGSWSEGELRTGIPLTGIHRLYAYDWPVQGERELTAMIDNEPSVWELPATFGMEEIYLERVQQRSLFQQSEREQWEFGQSENKSGNVTGESFFGWVFTARKICSNDEEMNRLFFAILQRRCSEVAFVDQSDIGRIEEQRRNEPGLLFWDIGETDQKKIISVLKQLRTVFPQTTISVFMSAPRSEERIMLQSAGADQVIAKPFDIHTIMT